MEAAAKPNFANAVALRDIPDGGMLLGTVGSEEVLLVRRGAAVFAIDAHCTHYHGPLSEGLLVGDTLRCPLHHACFDIRTGLALRAPALDSIGCWRVERSGDTLFVRERLDEPARTAAPSPPDAPRSVVIVGGGAAGLAAAVTLRREGYQGALCLISSDDSAPYDRPNLSKDFLAGNAPAEWMPLRAPEFYKENHIELVLSARVTTLDVRSRHLRLQDGRQFSFDALLLATGAEPVRLPIRGATDEQVCMLRTFADCQAILAKVSLAKRVVVVGASFIGLEVAASLRARGIEVQVVARDKVPMERVLGTEVGHLIQALHQSHGVEFHLGTTIEQVRGRRLTLSDASSLEADFLIVGAGVRPDLALAQAAGLAVDRGVLVNEYLQTGAPGVFAAGDIARWPDAHSGERIRVEHWVVAQRQGQVAAKNILGQAVRFDAVPFFWSQHYDMTVNYVGHAEHWDAIEVQGTLAAHDCAISYKQGERIAAVATIGRDRASLQAELAMENIGTGHER